MESDGESGRVPDTQVIERLGAPSPACTMRVGCWCAGFLFWLTRTWGADAGMRISKNLVTSAKKRYESYNEDEDDEDDSVVQQEHTSALSRECEPQEDAIADGGACLEDDEIGVGNGNSGNDASVDVGSAEEPSSCSERNSICEPEFEEGTQDTQVPGMQEDGGGGQHAGVSECATPMAGSHAREQARIQARRGTSAPGTHSGGAPGGAHTIKAGRQWREVTVGQAAHAAAPPKAFVGMTAVLGRTRPVCPVSVSRPVAMRSAAASTPMRTRTGHVQRKVLEAPSSSLSARHSANRVAGPVPGMRDQAPHAVVGHSVWAGGVQRPPRPSRETVHTWPRDRGSMVGGGGSVKGVVGLEQLFEDCDAFLKHRNVSATGTSGGGGGGVAPPAADAMQPHMKLSAGGAGAAQGSEVCVFVCVCVCV
jgi:hypothetical protein